MELFVFVQKQFPVRNGDKVLLKTKGQAEELLAKEVSTRYNLFRLVPVSIEERTEVVTTIKKVIVG